MTDEEWAFLKPLINEYTARLGIALGMAFLRHLDPGAIKAELGEGVTHQTSRSLNNHLEQDHCGIKGRSRPMRGFKSVASTRCVAFSDPLRREARLSLGDRRWFHLIAIREQCRGETTLCITSASPAAGIICTAGLIAARP